jgi:hypothetical protein
MSEWDAFKIHLTQEVSSVIHAMNTTIVIIHGGMISQLHVLEDKPFKDPVKQWYSKWLLVGAIFWCGTAMPVDQDHSNHPSRRLSMDLAVIGIVKTQRQGMVTRARLRRGADKSLAFPISYFPICSTTKRIFLRSVCSSGGIRRVNTFFQSHSLLFSL